MKPSYYLLAAAIAICCPALKAQTYTYQIVPSCDGLSISPYAMNALGIVVGAAYNSGSSVSSAFVYNIATGACKIYQSKSGTSFTAVSETGEIVGLDATGSYLIKNGKIQQLPNFPNSAVTQYCCFNSSTGVLGGIYKADPFGLVYAGFYDANGKLTSLPYNPNNTNVDFQLYGMNNKGVLVGADNTGQGTAGFVIQSGKASLQVHQGSMLTYFYGINDNNLVVGYYYSNTNPSGYFLYNIDTGTWTDISLGTACATTPIGITNSGVIAASCDLGGGLLIATPTGN